MTRAKIPDMPPKHRQNKRFSAPVIALETVDTKPGDDSECRPVAAPAKKSKRQTDEQNFPSTAPSPAAPISSSSAEAGAASIAVAPPADGRVHSGGRAWSQLRLREKGTYVYVKAELLFRRGITLDMDEADFNSLDKPATGPMFRKIWCRRGDVRKKDSITNFMRGNNRLLSEEEMDVINAKKSAVLKIRMPRGSTTTMDLETSRAEAAHVSTGEDAVHVRAPTWEHRLADEGIALRADLAAHGIILPGHIPHDAKVWSAWQKKTARISRPRGRWSFGFSIADLVNYVEHDIAFDAEGVELVAGVGEVSRVRYLIWGPEAKAFLGPIHKANNAAAAAYELLLAAHKATPEYKAALAQYKAQMVVYDPAVAARKTAVAAHKTAVATAVAAHAAAVDGTAVPEAPRKPPEPALPARGEAIGGSMFFASLHGNPKTDYGKWMRTHRYVMDNAEDAERFRRDRAEAMRTSRKFSMRELNETRAMIPGDSHWTEFLGMDAVRTALATQGIRLRRHHTDTGSTPDYHLLFDGVDEKVEAKTESPCDRGSFIGMRRLGGLPYGPNDFGQFHIVRGSMARVIPMRCVGADGVVRTTFTSKQLGAPTVRLTQDLCRRFPAHKLDTPAGMAAFAAACKAASSVPHM
jgi:hypothetical protein